MRNISFLTLILVSTSLLSYHHAEASHGLLPQEFGNRLLRRYGGNLEGDGWFNKRYPGLQERAETKKIKDKKKKPDKHLKVSPKEKEEDLEETPDKKVPKSVKVPEEDKKPQPKGEKENKEENKPVKKKPNGKIKEVKSTEPQGKKIKEEAVKDKEDVDDDEPESQSSAPQVNVKPMSTSAVFGLAAVGGVFAVVTGLFAFVRKKKNKEMTKNIMSTSANAWEKQNSTYEVMDDVEDVEAKPIGSYTVVATYTPALADELDIQPGDKVTILVEYDDGWVQGINETRGGAKGVFPRHCVDMNTALNDKRSSSIGGYTIVDLN